MSGVDVLHEMKLASDRLFDAGLHGDLSLDVAADAVAELIEVDLEYDEVLSKWSGERYEPDDYGVYGSDFYRCLCCENESGAGVLNRGVQHEADCVVAAIEAVETRRSAALSRVRGAE